VNLMEQEVLKTSTVIFGGFEVYVEWKCEAAMPHRVKKYKWRCKMLQGPCIVGETAEKPPIWGSL
jgi:hypothetical protein